jgi:hypothetical protein
MEKQGGIKMKKPTIKQVVAFSILMQHGTGIISKAPVYIKEKMEETFEMEHPDRLLDGKGKELFDEYMAEWKEHIGDDEK